MNIPDKAVEAAARAIAKSANADYWVDEIAKWEAQEEWEKEVFKESSYPADAYEDRDDYIRQARAALDAATPFIRAEALRDYADAVEKNHSFRYWDRREIAQDVRAVATERETS